MNNTQTAKNGFKTFVITLVVSLTVFGFFYYFLSARTKIPDIEKETSNAVTNSKDTLALSVNPNSPEDQTTSPFMDLSQNKMDVKRKVVLSESTQSTSSVPETGGESITIGLIVSSVILFLGFYVVYIGPRRYALNNFEKKVLDDLDI